MKREERPRDERIPGRIRRVTPGDLIREKKPYVRAIDGIVEMSTYRVLKIYPYHVLTEDIVTGFLRCFSYGDLIAMGLEEQEPHLEALRYNKKEQEGRRHRQG